MALNRRNILALAAVAAGGTAVARFGPALLPARQFEFKPVARPAGFRRIERSDGITAANLLSGFGTGTQLTPPLNDTQTCNLVFSGHPTGSGHLAIAVFSDFFCPYCRVLDVQVRDLAAGDDRITVVPHEVPLLGVPSQFAARAVIAAEAQGASEAFHSRLIRTNFVPNPAYLRSVAEAEGLDVAQFQHDMQSALTDSRLHDSMAVFRAFGFAGTPALAVGRTLVNGAISLRDLRALVALEIAEDAPVACR